MNAEELAFYLLSLISIISGLAMITIRKPVTSLMSLVLCFFCLAGLFTMLQAPFVAALQVLLYAGAILVLFLFAIMLLSPHGILPGGKPFRFHPVLALFLFLTLIFEMVWMVRVSFPVVDKLYYGYGVINPEFGNLEAVGETLFKDFLLPFEILSLILLVAIVGATVLAKRRLK